MSVGSSVTALSIVESFRLSPTAVRPFSGLDSYTGRASSIIPHVKFAMKTVPTQKVADPKLMYTTGTVTVQNYIQAKAGQKASFHHGLGALVVEVDDNGFGGLGNYPLIIMGSFYDLDLKVANGVITKGHRPEAMVWGDIHVYWLEPWMRDLCWGQEGILKTLNPKVQVMHDLLDFRSRNHHDVGKPWLEYKKLLADDIDVAQELSQVKEFLMYARSSKIKTIVVASNHDEALSRWLQEKDWRQDVRNSEVYLRLNKAAMGAVKKGNSFKVMEEAIGNIPDVEYLGRDDSYIVCKRYDGGVELAMHGDLGANGGRGNPLVFAAIGRKSIIGHHHAASWVDDCVTVGVTGNLDMGYNRGLSGWSHTNSLVYPNGKRTLFTIYNKKWRLG